MIIFNGGELENCATLPQDFASGYNSSSSGTKITNNGTMILADTWTLDRSTTFYNYGTLIIANRLSIRRNSIFNNFGIHEGGNVSVGGNGAYLNHGAFNGTGNSIVQDDGHLVMHAGSTFTGDDFLVENTILNAGEITINNQTIIRQGAVWTNDGGCLTTSNLLISGIINGITCGTITVSETSILNTPVAELNGNLAVVDLTPPSPPSLIVDTNIGTIAPSVTWVSCGCNSVSPTLSINDTSSQEGNNLVFTITNTNSTPFNQDINIGLTYINGTATNADYTGTNTITLPANQSSVNFDVSTTDDTLIEGAETFEVEISTSNSAVTISDNLGEGTIIDNDNVTTVITNRRITHRVKNN